MKIEGKTFNWVVKIYANEQDKIGSQKNKWKDYLNWKEKIEN